MHPLNTSTPSEPMKKLSFQLQFHTPAFLGDATQSARWRTPPFKAQLRQWWRVAYAAQRQLDVDVDVRDMREMEGQLFGNAWLEDNFCKSLVRIRLDQWTHGRLNNWVPTQQVHHPEVGGVGSDLYLGYGPLTLPRGTRQPVLKAGAAIQAGESAKFSLAYPDTDAHLMESALTLMQAYGTVGGRSRNGWGSYNMLASMGTPLAEPSGRTRDWFACLRQDWPHAIGSDDDGALVWQTKQAFNDWKQLFKVMAETKIGIRRLFLFPHAQPDGAIHDRHWLSYPITRHDVADWKRKNLRLPNTLRFKVRPTADGQLVGVVFHMPHKPPAEFGSTPQTLERIWRQVHSHLDQSPSLKRIPA